MDAYAEAVQDYGWNRCHSERSGCFQSTVPGDENVIFIHEYGCRKPKLADTGGNLSNLLLGMCTGVFGVRPDLLDRQVSVRVGHDDAPFAGARALTRMGRQNQMGQAASYVRAVTARQSCRRFGSGQH